MSYTAQELSLYAGEPVELFLFRDSIGQAISALTTGEDDLLDGLVLYKPGVVNRTSVRQTTDDPSGGLQIKVPNDSTLAQQFKAYLPSKPINLTIYRYHLTDVALERRVLFIGQVVTVSFDGDGIATINCEPITKSKGKKVPWQVYKKNCNWALYEHGCGVLRTLFATPVLTYTASGDTVTATVVGTFTDGWFRNGYIERADTGERRFITGHIGTQLRLDYPFFDLPLGTTLIAQAGCDRTEATCKVKFNNLPNFLGFDYIPDENPYDTNFGPAVTPEPPASVALPRSGSLTAGG